PPAVVACRATPRLFSRGCFLRTSSREPGGSARHPRCRYRRARRYLRSSHGGSSGARNAGGSSKAGRRRGLNGIARSAPAALLVLLSAPAGAGIIAADLGLLAAYRFDPHCLGRRAGLLEGPEE